MAYAQLITLKGPAGKSIYAGSGGPSAGLGNVGDVYIDTNGFLYPAKGTNGWAAAGTSIVGKAGVDGARGSQVTFGTAVPGTQYGLPGDFYYLTTTQSFYYYTSTGWSNLGTVTGIKGDRGEQGLVGPQSPGLRYGDGAPSTTNPSLQLDGDYYIRRDTTPQLLYGPRVNGSFPASGVSVSGGQNQSGNGPPSNAIGATGDVYYDLSNYLFYPPKTAQGWTLAPISIVGPQGPVGISALGGSQAGIGPVASASAFAVTTTPQVVPIANSTMPCVFYPASGSALLNVQVVNNSGPALTLQLYNNTTGTVVISGLSFGAGTTLNSPIYSPTQYPLVANNEYVWRVSAAAAGTSTFGIYPTYLMPSATASVGITYTGSAGFASSTTFSGSNTMLPFLGNPIANGWNFKPFRSGYIYDVIATFYPTGTSTATTQATLKLMSYNTTGQVVATLGTYTITANGRPQRMGPFAANSIPTVGNSTIQYYYNVTGGNVTGTLNVETLVLL